MAFARIAQQRFFGVSALFAGSAALTTVWCESMSGMGAMPMPGGWKMSMAWMRMPGQSWADAALSFIGMWTVMMIAMMMPSLMPALWRYRETVSCRGEKRLAWLTTLTALGYFFVWAMIGVAVFVPGVALARAEMEWPALARAVPVAAGVVVLIAGTLQFTTWKTHHLACWRGKTGSGCFQHASAAAAWQHGVRLGVRCSCGCAGLTAVLLAIGIMDLRAMAFVMAAITAERLMPGGERVARATGAVVVAIGLVLIARAARLG